MMNKQTKIEAVAEKNEEAFNYEDFDECNHDAPKWRSETEVSEAIDEFWDKIWYNRIMTICCRTMNMSKEDYEQATQKEREQLLTDASLAVSCEGMKRREEKYGHENLGPWSDFEWGMLNGKLSALRWVLGEEWDFLDT